MERLQVLIVSQDPNLVGLLRAILQDLGVAGCSSETDSTRASEVLGRRHFDGIILDCDDLVCARATLTRIRTGSSNRQSPVIAIFKNAADMHAMQNLGAELTVCQPASPDVIKEHLNKAFDAMQKEHRRYFRYKVELPLFLGTDRESLVPARLLNVSAEGLAIVIRGLTNPKGAVRLQFDLPSIEPYRIEAKGEVAWSDTEGRVGIKLSHMPEEARRKYAQWLDVLYGQHEFRRLSEEESQPNASRQR